MVGNKDEYRVRIWIFAILFDRAEFVFVRAASEQCFYTADKKNLEWGHQRRSAGTIQHFGQIGLYQIEFEQAEFPHVRGNQMLHNGIAALLAEKSLIAHENVGGTQLSRFNLRDESFGLGKRPHQKASRTFETSVRANSRESRWKAGEFSSKKLLNSCDT